MPLVQSSLITCKEPIILEKTKVLQEKWKVYKVYIYSEDKVDDPLKVIADNNLWSLNRIGNIYKEASCYVYALERIRKFERGS